MTQHNRQQVLNRLRRIEGQVGGLIRMVEDDRYCVDILVQTEAVRAALRKVSESVLRDHANTCVEEALESGEIADQRAKFSELVELFGKFSR